MKQFEYSRLSKKFTEGAGISELMKDLGRGLALAREEGKDLFLMGGGNPAHIPEVEVLFQKIWKEISEDVSIVNHLLGDYSDPQGDKNTREELARYLSIELDSDIGFENIAFTQGSQSAFFFLLNFFAGDFGNGSFKKILLPITPEYIGYADQGIVQDMFVSLSPIVQELPNNRFIYLPDMDRVAKRLSIGDIGAICLSRPTNPSGNVLSWDKVLELKSYASRYKIPLILDNAYGYPFPNILFDKEKMSWDPSMVHVFSLSKMGLPGLRIGIVVASKELASKIGEMNSVQNLAPGSIGGFFLKKLLVDGEIGKISKNIIQPYYKNKSLEVQNIIDTLFGARGIPYQIHESRGALFLWLRFPGNKKSSRQIYDEAKNHGLFLIAGDWFFPGLEENFSHKNECIRLTYSRDLEEVRRGIEILANILDN